MNPIVIIFLTDFGSMLDSLGDQQIIFPQTGLSCRGPGGELEAGRGYTGRRTILHARFVCVFTVFERSRFTTLQRNGGYSHVCMCFISENGPGAFQTSSGSTSPANLKNDQKTVFPRIVRGPLGCHLLSSLVPKSRFRGSGKIIFFKKSFEVKKDAELPPEYFPCGGSA